MGCVGREKNVLLEVGVHGLICFPPTSLPLLAAAFQYWWGIGRASRSWGWGSEEPSPAERKVSFPAPGDNSGPWGTVCCHAGGEGALDGPGSSCLGCVEQELSGLWAGHAQEETEGQEQSWAGAAGGAGRCGGARKRMQREGERRKRPKVGAGDEPEHGLVKITTEPLHTVRGQALPVVLGPASHLEESRLCCGLDVLHPYRPSWPPSTAAGSGIQLRLHPSLLQLL